MKKPSFITFLTVVMATVLPLNLHGQATSKPKVVVISLDAFAADSLHDPHQSIPTLRELEQKGAYAVSMQPINPTITWPNHTAIVSGVDASRHHVLVNGLIVNQRTGAKPEVDADAPKSRLVAAPTVYDVAHAAGLTTAEVDWVAITHASTIDWSFAEMPDPDGPIARDLIDQKLVTRDDLVRFGRPSQVWRDRIYTEAAADILRKHHADLLLLHLLALDGIEHQTGYGNDSGRNTIAFLDDRVKDIIQAVRDNGDLDRTTFLIVSDHGQQSVHHDLHADVLLHQQNLSAGTKCISEGGFALVYQQHATPASIAALKQLFTGKPGVFAALTPDEAAKDGWPTPAQTDQAPDLLLYAGKGYSFSDDAATDFVTDTLQSGAHGYPNTEPLMQAIFIASGAGINAVGEIPAFSNLDVAPTIAKLLHLSMPDVQGKPITRILKQ